MLVSFVVGLCHINSISVISCSDMMYEMRRRNLEPTLLPTQGIFNLQHHICMEGEERAFNDAVSYSQRGNRVGIEMTCQCLDGSIITSVIPGNGH